MGFWFADVCAAAAADIHDLQSFRSPIFWQIYMNMFVVNFRLCYFEKNIPLKRSDLE